jgi:cytochrome b561
MQLHDTKTTYGWVSIILHWLTATAIFGLWFIGDWTQGLDEDEFGTWVDMHISIAASMYILIWARIIWRIKSGHPRIEGQSRFSHCSAKLAHYILLIAIAAMLISGPIMVWTGGWGISVFGWFEIPSPTGEIVWINEAAATVHGISATVLLITVLLHIGGAFKHLMFNEDETFISMLKVKVRKG